MTETEQLVRRNIAAGELLVLPHAARQMKRRNIRIETVLATIADGEVIEQYPHDDAGPALLMLQRDGARALHLVWRIEAATAGPAVLVTVYEPDPRSWSSDFRQRLSTVGQ